MFNVKQIKPEVKGESDKYSWNLYSWMNKYKNYESLKVYYTDNEFDLEDFDNYKVLIGCKIQNTNDILGNRLTEIIRNGIKKTDCYCFCAFGGFDTKTFIDITDIFWKNYIQKGRCFLFGHDDVWLLGDKNRYTYVGKSSRRCNWCGRWEHREILKETIIKRKEIWS